MEGDAVIIVPYDPQWPEQYEVERQRIVRALGDKIVGIEHFGSTAIPGLMAKPVIDILVLVEQLEPDEAYIESLQSLGYVHQTWPGDAPDHVFLRKGLPRTHHLHIVQKGSYEHLRHIAFRDYLRTHPETARAYAELKIMLAQVHAHDRDAYTNAKTDFVRDIEAKVLRQNPEQGASMPKQHEEREKN